MSIPKHSKRKYNQEKTGYFGQFGRGNNVQCTFLQTALSLSELDHVTLVEKIPGSEKWDVRDLFQRDVDHKRVEKDIMPYLKSKNFVKFFNPLTLVLMPFKENSEEIDPEITYSSFEAIEEEGGSYSRLERDSFFQFNRYEENPAFSKLCWSDSRVRLVAIDGQHRLSALKRWKQEGGASSELSSWTIPVVILGFFKDSETTGCPSILEIVRKTFVNINTKSEKVSESRQILLSDEDACHICTQEIIQRSHTNDIQNANSKNDTIVPLVFFDWRGKTQLGENLQAEGSVVKVRELDDWLRHYLLKIDKNLASRCLGLSDEIPPIDLSKDSKGITSEQSEKVRKAFKSDLLPAFVKLFEEFHPFKGVIDKMRALEKKSYNGGSDLSKHAYDKLRFGTYRGEDVKDSDVNSAFEEIIDEMTEIVGEIPQLLQDDIGRRAIVSAFGSMKEIFEKYFNNGEVSDYKTFSSWFVESLNKTNLEIFESEEKQARIGTANLLRHIVWYDGNVVNYRIDQVESAFGSVVKLLILKNSPKKSKLKISDEMIVGILEEIEDTLIRGYKKEVKADMKDKGLHNKLTEAEFKSKVEKDAEKKTDDHLAKLKKYAGI